LFQVGKSETKASPEKINAIKATLAKAFPNIKTHVVSDKEIKQRFGNGRVYKDGENSGIKGGLDVATGELYFNEELIDATTPIHEYGHIYTAFLKKHYPTLYRQLLEAARGTKEHKYVLAEYIGAYSQIEDKALREEFILEEATVQAIGNKGAYLAGETRFQKLKELIKRTFKRFNAWVADKLGVNGNIEDMSFDDLITQVAKDLLAGKEISKETFAELNRETNTPNVGKLVKVFDPKYVILIDPKDANKKTFNSAELNALADNYKFNEDQRKSAFNDSFASIDANGKPVVEVIDKVAIEKEMTTAVQHLAAQVANNPVRRGLLTLIMKGSGRNLTSIPTLFGNLLFDKGTKGYDMIVNQNRRHYENSSHVKIRSDSFFEQLAANKDIRSMMGIFRGRRVNTDAATTQTDIVSAFGLGSIKIDGKSYTSLVLPDAVVANIALSLQSQMDSTTITNPDGTVVAGKNNLTVKVQNHESLPNERTGFRLKDPNRFIEFENQAQADKFRTEAMKKPAIAAMKSAWDAYNAEVFPYVADAYLMAEFKKLHKVNGSYWPLRVGKKGQVSNLNTRDIRGIVGDASYLKIRSFGKDNYLDASDDAFLRMSRYADTAEKYVHFMPMVRNYQNIYETIKKQATDEGLGDLMKLFKNATETLYQSAGYDENPSFNERLYDAAIKKLSTALFALSPSQPIKQASTFGSLIFSQDAIKSKYIMGQIGNYGALMYNALTSVLPGTTTTNLNAESYRKKLIAEIMANDFAKNIIVRISQSLPPSIDMSLGNQTSLAGTSFALPAWMGNTFLKAGNGIGKFNEEYLLQWMKRPDVASVIVTYGAAKAQIEAEQPLLTGAVKDEAVARLTTDAIYQTHQTFDGFDRSMNQVSDKAYLSKFVNLFAGQTFKQLDRLAELFIDYVKNPTAKNTKKLISHTTFVTAIIPAYMAGAELLAALARAWAQGDEDKIEKLLNNPMPRYLQGLENNMFQIVPSLGAKVGQWVTAKATQGLADGYNQFADKDALVDTPVIGTLDALATSINKVVAELTDEAAKDEKKRLKEQEAMYKVISTILVEVPALMMGFSKDASKIATSRGFQQFGYTDEERVQIDKMRADAQMNKERKAASAERKRIHQEMLNLK
jgi:hypothetical protein